jgi:DNA-binding GntR family transcriptional regulator
MAAVTGEQAWARIARDLAARIEAGEYAAGTEMPPARSPRWRERYGVSPETIRLAMLALAGTGLLTRTQPRPPHGWAVAGPADGTPAPGLEAR